MTEYHFKWSEYFAGWAGGVAGLLIGHPNDTIKVHYQNIHKTSHFDIIKNLFKNEGVLGFYKGFFMPFLTAGTVNSLFFGTYANTLNFLEGHSFSKDIKEPKLGNVLFAAMFAGIPTTLITCPTEVIKIQLQMRPKHHMIKSPAMGFINLMKMIKASGLRGLYRGFGVNVIRDVPSYGIYMMTYTEILKLSGNKNDFMIMMAGGIAGTISWLSIVPLDVIKSRMQGDLLSSPKYRNTWHCMKQSFREDGIRVFFRGTLMIVVRSFPVNAATFLVYEYTSHYLGN